MPALNRSIQPEFSEITKLNIKPVSSYTLKKGIPVYVLNIPDSSVLKVDFVFNAGLRNQPRPAIATATNTLLTDGTNTRTSKQIATQLDQFGSYFQTQTGPDDSQLNLFCLPKHLVNCLSIIQDVLNNPTFPQDELKTYINNAVQRFKINSQRNSFLGRRAFYASIFGNQNAYGSPVNIEDYESISRETLSLFHKKNILSGCKYILLSGDFNHSLLTSFEGLFDASVEQNLVPDSIHLTGQVAQQIFIHNPYSAQSNLRIGKQFVNRKHTDFNKLQLLNLALGGYFGSRLMKNIREEKGLTYGIYSALESYWDGGAFYIETEINTELREKGQQEIFKEIKKLRDEMIPENELVLVKNYMIGSFLRGIDGPFSLLERHKICFDYGFSYDYFQNFVDTIKSTTALELQQLANEYFAEDSFTTVIVGKE